MSTLRLSDGIRESYRLLIRFFGGTLLLNHLHDFSLIFEIQIHEKNFLDTKKISFSKADFYKVTHIYI